MIANEVEYEEARKQLNDLKKQYCALSAYDREKPYIGQQMARDIYKLTSETKLYEYGRFEKHFSTESN